MIDSTKDVRAKRLKLLLDAGALSGFASFLFGLYLIWHPLAPLIGGLIVAGGCGFAGYDQLRKERSR